MNQKYNELDIADIDASDFELSPGELASLDDVYDLAGERMPARAQPGVPHCDCEEAYIAGGGTAGERRHGFHMRRVEALKDGSCPHCGHTAFLRPIERPNKNYATSYGPKKEKREPKASLIALWDRKEKPKILKNSKEMPKSFTPALIMGNKGGLK